VSEVWAAYVGLRLAGAQDALVLQAIGPQAAPASAGAALQAVADSGMPR
jgi:hypothetical protein